MTSDEHAQLRHQLISEEGLRLFAYTDTVGRLSIGVGRNLTDRGISQDEAMYLLDNDIATAGSDLAVHYPWTQGLDAVRRSVLLDLCFNIGIDRLAGFVQMLAAVQRGDYAEAGRQMLASEWANQVKSRATRLAEMMTTGVAT